MHDLQAYSDVSAGLRKQASKEFEKDFLKLISSSVFAKIMENICNHKDMRLVANEKKCLRLAMKPNFKYGIKFSESLIGARMDKTTIKVMKVV